MYELFASGVLLKSLKKKDHSTLTSYRWTTFPLDIVALFYTVQGQFPSLWQCSLPFSMLCLVFTSFKTDCKLDRTVATWLIWNRFQGWFNSVYSTLCAYYIWLRAAIHLHFDVNAKCVSVALQMWLLTDPLLSWRQFSFLGLIAPFEPDCNHTGFTLMKRD